MLLVTGHKQIGIRHFLPIRKASSIWDLLATTALHLALLLTLLIDMLALTMASYEASTIVELALAMLNAREHERHIAERSQYESRKIESAELR